MILLLTSHPGVFLLKNLRWSVKWSKTQWAFTSAISAKHPPEVLEQWAEMRKEFDDNRTKPNPYEEPRVRKSTIIYFTPAEADLAHRCHPKQAEAGTYR